MKTILASVLLCLSFAASATPVYTCWYAGVPGKIRCGYVNSSLVPTLPVPGLTIQP